MVPYTTEIHTKHNNLPTGELKSFSPLKVFYSHINDQIHNLSQAPGLIIGNKVNRLLDTTSATL